MDLTIGDTVILRRSYRQLMEAVCSFVESESNG